MTKVNKIGAIIIFFVFLFVFAKWGPSIPFSVLSQQKGEPMIVIGEAKVAVTPDIAKVTFGIEETGISLKLVQESVNKKSNKLTDELQKLGIKEKDIKTTNYSIYPESDYQTTPPKITGYRVSISYEVTIRNFDKTNDALVIATSSGANIVGGVNFDISEDVKEEKLNEARAEASAKAKRKAEGLAKAAGVTLGKIINISESQGGDFPIPIALMEKAGSPMAEEPTPADIKPGETELSVLISLSYEIR